MSRKKKKAVKRNTPVVTVTEPTPITPAIQKRVEESWSLDPVAEDHLHSLGLDFDIRVIEIGKIDRTASLRNNARIGEALIESLSMEYAIMREQGDVFPSTVVSPAPSASSFQYVTQSGNHRTEMECILDREYLRAYVITTDNPSAIDTFARSINRKTGKRQDQKEAMVNALHELQKDDGRTVVEVSEQYGLKTGTLNTAVRAMNTRKTLEGKGVEGAYNLSQDSVVNIYRLRHWPKVMVAVATLAIRFSLPSMVLRNVITDVGRGSDDDEKLGRVAKWHKRYEGLHPRVSPSSRKKSVRKTATQGELFRTYFGSLYNFFHRGSRTGKPFTKLSQLKMSSEAEIERYRAEWKEIRQALDSLLK